MFHIRPNVSRFSSFCMAVMLATSIGCRAVQHHDTMQPGDVPISTDNCLPRELSKVVLPTYRIEPPDILMIHAIQIAPKSPYRLKTFDSIGIRVWGTLPDAPISDTYIIEPGGMVNLGVRYGAVKVSGLTVEEARNTIEQHLRIALKDLIVVVTLAGIGANQEIAGQHLVGPDGTVTLGSYGSVSVVGHTIAGAKMVIEQYLSQFLDNPEISVDVYAYNSKVYYIITQGAGFGDGVWRFPITGNETVLDAIAQINGLEQVSSKRIWIARPTLGGTCQVLPVCWDDITAKACTGTNYQVLPGDRVFIEEDKLIAFDTAVGKFVAPIERMMGFVLLSTGTATRLSGPVLRGGGNPRSTF